MMFVPFLPVGSMEIPRLRQLRCCRAFIVVLAYQVIALKLGPCEGRPLPRKNVC
jgi:hypothetical protein